jgi:hypothetical protein
MKVAKSKPAPASIAPEAPSTPKKPKAVPGERAEPKPPKAPLVAAQAPTKVSRAVAAMPAAKHRAAEVAPKAPAKGVARSKPASRNSRPVYVVRSGAPAGRPDFEAAFSSKQEAVQFLANQHGLDTEETRKLNREMALKLNRKWHGSEACAIKEIPMSPDRAKRALSGELFESV